MEVLLPILIIVALGFLVYGWIRLRQEISAKITQLIFRKTHREGEGAVGRTHLITPNLQMALGRSHRSHFPIEGPPDLHAVVCNAAHRQRRHAAPVERRPSIAVQRSGARGQEPSQSGTARHQGDEGM